VFHVLFASDRVGDRIEGLETDQPLQPISLREPVEQSLAMLIGAACDVVSDADAYSVPFGLFIMM